MEEKLNKQYNIVISDGIGEANVLNGTYSVTSNTPGYDNQSITPTSLEIIEGTNEYELKIAADGTLTLHVTETGESTGTAIVGATFIRCDANGTEYGDLITTDQTGNAQFQYVPYSQTETINIYYKQKSTDDTHTFDDSLKTITLEAQTKTVEVANPLPALRTFKLTDKNYSNLVIKSGTIILQ